VVVGSSVVVVVLVDEVVVVGSAVVLVVLVDVVVVGSAVVVVVLVDVVVVGSSVVVVGSSVVVVVLVDEVVVVTPQPGMAVCVQVPAPSHSSAVQLSPSSVHVVPDAVRQLSAVSLQTLLHSAPAVHGSPVWVAHRTDAVTHVSAPLQNAPSSQVDVRPNSGPVDCRTGPFVSVPLSAGAMESTAVVPLASSNPQRATSPVVDVSWLRSLKRSA
jgi:hypothetical protein